MIPFNDSRRQYEALRTEIDGAVARVLESGWYVHGAEHAAFEAEFAAAVGVKHCVGVANGTDALELGLLALGCGPGSEVVTVANAGFYASTAALKIGADPRYVDIEPKRLLIDPSLVAGAITSRTRVVVVTHLYGQLADVETVAEVAAAFGVPVLEDCAQAVGASRGGRRAGAFGAAGSFSFYPTKNLGAAGDGGAVVTDDGELAEKVRQLRQYGWTEKYRVSIPDGRNSRLDELQAAVLRAKLPHLSRWTARRRAIIGRYGRALSDVQGVRLVSGALADDVGHLAVLICDDREAVAGRLSASGVPTAVHYPIADHTQPVMIHRDGEDVVLPVTEDAVTRVLTLPCFAEMADVEVQQVCDVLSHL